MYQSTCILWKYLRICFDVPDLDVVYLLCRFSGLFNTAPKKPNPSPVSIKYSGPQAGGNVRSPPESTAETSPGVVDRLDTTIL